MDEAARDFQPPPHAAGEGLSLGSTPFCEIDGFEQIRDVALALRARHIVQLGVDGEIFFHGEVDVAGEGLGDDTDEVPHRIGFLLHVVACDHRAALGDGDKGGHHADEGGLAGAIRAQQAEDLAIRNLEADTFDRLEAPVTLDNVLDGDGRRRRCRGRRRCGPGGGRAGSHGFTSLSLGM
jgi:hypothetical protein